METRVFLPAPGRPPFQISGGEHERSCKQEPSTYFYGKLRCGRPVLSGAGKCILYGRPEYGPWPAGTQRQSASSATFNFTELGRHGGVSAIRNLEIRQGHY